MVKRKDHELVSIVDDSSVCNFPFKLGSTFENSVIHWGSRSFRRNLSARLHATQPDS